MVQSFVFENVILFGNFIQKFKYISYNNIVD